MGTRRASPGPGRSALRRWVAGLALAVGLLLPATASAQSALLLPRTAGSGVGAEAREEAIEATRQVLENEGWTVYTLEEVSLQLPARLSSCGPDDRCSFELRALLDVDVVVGLRLWGSEQQVERLAVVVTGVRGVGHRALGTVSAEVPLPFAVADATRQALDAWSAGQLPPTSPALVEHPEPIEPGRVEGSPLNWFLGGLLVLGSAPLLGYGINTLRQEGACLTEGPSDTCVERVRFQEGAAIFTGLGAALLIAGVVVWIAQPLRVAVYADRQQAGLTVTGRF